MNKISQISIEYIVLFLVVIIVFGFVMGPYIRNALSGKWREVMDTFGQGEVYYPNLTVTSQLIENRVPAATPPTTPPVSPPTPPAPATAWDMALNELIGPNPDPAVMSCAQVFFSVDTRRKLMQDAYEGWLAYRANHAGEPQYFSQYFGPNPPIPVREGGPTGAQRQVYNDFNSRCAI